MYTFLNLMTDGDSVCSRTNVNSTKLRLSKDSDSDS